MAVIVCKECGMDFDDNSKYCPNCGHEIKEELAEISEEVASDLICKKCGAVLKENQQFCPKCGTEKGYTNNKKCLKCGAIIDPGEKFCSKCGTKAKIDIQSDLMDKTKKIKNINKKKIGLIVGIIAIIVIIGIAASKIIPVLTISVDDLLAEGNYQKAFEKAKKDDAKKDVLLENIIAKYSYEISDGLKDPDSFKLSHVYYDGEDEIVFEVIGKNSYGGNVTNYYDYRYSEDDHEYQLFVYLSSLEEEETSYWDTSSEKLDKILKNVVRSTIVILMKDKDKKVSDEVVDRVNNLFKQNKLRNVELIPQISIIYPEKDKDDSV